MTLAFDSHYDNKTKAEERGQSFEVKTKKKVRRYKVDNGLIPRGAIKTCDYMFEIGNISKVFYVELKGINYADAIEQLRITICHEDMRTRHDPVKEKEAHIILSRTRPKENTVRMLKKDKFERELKIPLFFKNKSRTVEA